MRGERVLSYILYMNSFFYCTMVNIGNNVDCRKLLSSPKTQNNKKIAKKKCYLTKMSLLLCTMVHIMLDGNSKIGANVRSNLCHLTYIRLLISSK